MLTTKFLLAFLASLALVAAFDKAGAQERLMFYYAYLMDQPASGGNGKNIVSGHGNLNLKDFMELIDMPDPKQPSKSGPPKKPGSSDTKVQMSKLDKLKTLDEHKFGQIPPISAADLLEKSGHTGPIQRNLIFSGAKTHQELLEKVGGFIINKSNSASVNADLKQLAKSAMKSIIETRMASAYEAFKKKLDEENDTRRTQGKEPLKLYDTEKAMFEGSDMEFKHTEIDPQTYKDNNAVKDFKEVKAIRTNALDDGHKGNIQALINALKTACDSGRKRSACTATLPDFLKDSTQTQTEHSGPSSGDETIKNGPDEDGEGRDNRKPGGGGRPDEEQDGHKSKGKTGGEKAGDVKHVVKAPIEGNKFVDFLLEMSPETVKSLIDSIRNGTISAAGAQLAVKRGLSEAIRLRHNADKNEGGWAQMLAKITFDVMQYARYGVNPAFWQDVIGFLPGIAREIEQGKTAEEMLEIANRDLHKVVKAWSFTPLGLANEWWMKKNAEKAAAAKPPKPEMKPDPQSSAVETSKLVTYTTLGSIFCMAIPDCAKLLELAKKDGQTVA
ncbi:hypothetical protein QQS21_010430 [Conoideocrella luteorostrata]|uniref:Uncharacterized protein n=1 Tax=Conoideocrella luteorostrata TaxID=1105319 RepID=A0AAJ0CF15_9HYPO|nr:hypothetical protein QQS21_010430 [Conoideocrella luteorostrata]